MSSSPSEAWTALRLLVEGGAVGVVVTSIPDGGEPSAEMTAKLTVEERAQASRFRFSVDRTTYIAAHCLLARSVEAVLGPDSQAWRFESDGEGGKPVLRVAGQAPLYANLSHTRGAVAVAITRAGEVGVDAEASRPHADLEDLAASVLTDKECRAVAAAADPNEVFTRLWARKEAVIKAFGLGLGAPLDRIDILDLSAPLLPPDLPGAIALADVVWSAPLHVAVALLRPRIEHGVVDIPFTLLATEAGDCSAGRPMP